MKACTLLSTAVTLLSIAGCASAGTYEFTFNTLASGATDAQIATYMDNVLIADGVTCNNCVTVTGAVADKTYTGEGNVVGPNGKPATLGTTDGATNNSPSSTSCSGTITTSCTDTFLANTNDSSIQVSQEISISFSGLQISTVNFDYEIFPDGSCPTLSNCGGQGDPNLPDFEFTTGAASGGTNVFTKYGVVPSSTGSDGSSTKDGSTTEVSPQYIGTTGNLNVGSVSELNFVDWPATIGIDDLSITTTSSVPEPSSVVLLATACAAALFSLRRKFREQA